MQKTWLNIIIISGLFFYSCSGTKSLSDGEALYTGSRIHMRKVEEGGEWEMKHDTKKLTKLYWELWDLPNGAFWGTPFFRLIPTKLIIYNWFYTKKERKFNRWMRRNFGEEPVTIEDVDPDLKLRKAINIYENHGHFGTTGSYQLNYNKKKNKAYIHYYLEIPPAYTYHDIEYVADSLQKSIEKPFLNFQQQAYLHTGEEFDLDSIKLEKKQMWNYFQDLGYYYFDEEFVEVEADTTLGNKEIDIRVQIDQGVSDAKISRTKINDFQIEIDSITQGNMDDKFYRWQSGKIRKDLLDTLVHVSPGEYYSLKQTNQSIQNLSQLGIFAAPGINYNEVDGDSSRLNSVLSMRTLNATTIGVNARGNYKNTGYMGPAVGLNLTQLNVFNGAENLTFNLEGYYDFPIGVYRERVSNSSGVTFGAELSAPLIKTPFQFINQTYSLPKQSVSLTANYNNRRDYFEMVSWTAAYGITWKSSPKITHRINLIDVTFSDIGNTTERFDTVVASNPSLRNSLIDQFILGTSYTFQYNNSSTESKLIGTYFEGNIELAGNALGLLNTIFTNDEKGEKRILGIRYSQFARFSYDFRAYLRLGKYNQLAFRNVGGIGLAYGNSEYMPYIRQYFMGGSNSMRPLSTRTLGPGRYIELDQAEVNQVGDMKLEWNLEFRFRIGPRFNGALWTDAGNIWLLKEDPNRPYGEVRWNKIFQDSYLTTGAGIRIDLNILLLRFDYGIILYAPLFIDGYKWVWQNKIPLHGPVIGFGYPF